jgi:hypothetical protein
VVAVEIFSLDLFYLRVPCGSRHCNIVCKVILPRGDLRGVAFAQHTVMHLAYHSFQHLLWREGREIERRNGLTISWAWV